MFEEPITIRLDSVDSTSNYAANLLKQTKLPEFSLIVTKRQEKGRGQRGTIWHTEPEMNFTGTFILYPTIPINSYFVLQKSVALACLVTIQKFVSGKNIQIKWPNDLYVGGKKIGGILLESQTKNKQFEYLLAGIGVNINQKKFAPDVNNVTSIFLETNKAIDLVKFEKELGEQIQKHLRIIEERRINQEYYKYLYGYQKWMRYIDLNAQESFNGKIARVNQQGKIEIMLQDDSVRIFDLKEVKFTHEFLGDDAPCN